MEKWKVSNSDISEKWNLTGTAIESKMKIIKNDRKAIKNKNKMEGILLEEHRQRWNLGASMVA